MLFRAASTYVNTTHLSFPFFAAHGGMGSGKNLITDADPLFLLILWLQGFGYNYS
jgi:hypothetical protein